MAEISIREYRMADIPSLYALWKKVFGDPSKLIASFFGSLPDMGSAVVAVAEGRLVGMASVINGMELIESGKIYVEHENEPPVCAYIYAVAVEENFRGMGIGKKLVLEAEKLGRKRESTLCFTLPADEGLYNWYKDVLGFECVLYRKSFETECKAISPCMELSSTEYMMWRETMLRGKTHLHPSNPTLEFEKQFCKALGGGLYACSSGICTAYVDGETCVIKELITAFPDECELIAASVGAELGCKKSLYFLPSGKDGQPYLAGMPGSVPGDCVWSYTFD